MQKSGVLLVNRLFIVRCVIDYVQVSQGTFSFAADALSDSNSSNFVSNYDGVVNKLFLHYRGGPGVKCSYDRLATWWGCTKLNGGPTDIRTLVTLYNASYVAGEEPYETIVSTAFLRGHII